MNTQAIEPAAVADDSRERLQSLSAIAERLLDKLLAYRVFSDSSGKMNLSLTQTGGGLLLVSQFTLLAETRKGLRPAFGPAMPPAGARQLFEHLVQTAQRKHPVVASGVFGADMQVSLVNDGPVTLLFDTDNL